jgi:hypothetical protein
MPAPERLAAFHKLEAYARERSDSHAEDLAATGGNRGVEAIFLEFAQSSMNFLRKQGLPGPDGSIPVSAIKATWHIAVVVSPPSASLVTRQRLLRGLTFDGECPPAC